MKIETRLGRWKKPVIVMIGILTQMSIIQQMEAKSPAQGILDLNRPLVIAHRGYPTIAPENTLPGFELGKLMGADMVELDYHLSKDGIAIVIHDSILDRTTDAVSDWGQEDLKVSERTAREMRDLDAGSWYAEKYEETALPTLKEALAVIQKDGGICLIERKGGDPEHIVALLGELDMVNKVILQSFDWEFLNAVHEMLPEQILGALGPQKTWDGKNLSTEEKELTPAWVDAALKTGAQIIGWNGQVNQESIDYAHKKGVKLIVYTVNEVEPAQELFEAGIDGIITNNTGLIWKALALTK